MLLSASDPGIDMTLPRVPLITGMTKSSPVGRADPHERLQRVGKAMLWIWAPVLDAMTAAMPTVATPARIAATGTGRDAALGAPARTSATKPRLAASAPSGYRRRRHPHVGPDHRRRNAAATLTQDPAAAEAAPGILCQREPGHQKSSARFPCLGCVGLRLRIGQAKQSPPREDTSKKAVHRPNSGVLDWQWRRRLIRPCVDEKELLQPRSARQCENPNRKGNRHSDYRARRGSAAHDQEQDRVEQDRPANGRHRRGEPKAHRDDDEERQPGCSDYPSQHHGSAAPPIPWPAS